MIELEELHVKHKKELIRLKAKRILIYFTIISLLLFIGSIFFQVFSEKDPYQYYTGLGKEFDISPDDQQIAFSYFLDGNEAIYKANIDGSDIEKISEKTDGRFRSPKFSFDGEKLLFLSEDEDGVQNLMVMNQDGSNRHQVTDGTLHVTDAVFSPTNETIYFIGFLASELGKAEGETKEGYDLYKINTDGSAIEQLTDKDHFTMNDLSISPDGKELYYSLYEGTERLHSFSLEGKKETPVISAKDDMYASILSKDKKQLAYTAISRESMESSLFKYELYIRDLETNKSKRLTKLKTYVQSPVFFQNSNKIAFLEYENWPSDPEVYRLMTVSTEGADLEEIDLNLPKSDHSHFFKKTINVVFSELAIAVYYVLFFTGLILLAQRRSGKIFRPSFISLTLSVIFFLGSFAIGAMTNPWFGIWLGMVAAAMFICSLVLMLVSFIVSKFGRKA